MSDGGEADANPTCFIIMPMTTRPEFLERYGRADHFELVLEFLIEPAVELAGYEPIPPSGTGSSNIQADIIHALHDADMVLVDLSTLNPNVFLEMGIRSALDGPMCLVYDGLDPLPFDTATVNTHTYPPPPVYDTAKRIEAMAEHLTATFEKAGGRNQLWQFFGRARPPLAPAALRPEDALVESKVDAMRADLAQLRRELARGPVGYSNDRIAQAAAESAASAVTLGMERRGIPGSVTFRIDPESGFVATRLKRVHEDDQAEVLRMVGEATQRVGLYPSALIEMEGAPVRAPK